MDNVLKKFQKLKIPLKEIRSATKNFNADNRIGVGGFGKVYIGEVSHSSEGRIMAAIKRLDSEIGQGTPEFLKEIISLSRYSHENLISLLGFCYEHNERILVYKLASNKSLDKHLNSPDLTWTIRLKICLGAAKGLSYLHDPKETHQRLIHCDVKSANILLDEHWNAKVADFGFSTMGSANEHQSAIINLAAGTEGYIDPQYVMTHTLTKESDVYSFGVVLFEVLCGKFCSTYSNNRVAENFVPRWIEHYKQNKLNDIILKKPKIQPLDQSALEIFSNIAYRCLMESPEKRPGMAEVVTELETAFQIQRFCERKPLFDYKKIITTAKPPLDYSSDGELWKLLSKGVLLDSGKIWFSINKMGEHCEMISFAECAGSSVNELDQLLRKYISRFPVGTCYSRDGIFKTHVKPQFLSPGITYTVNLVFKFSKDVGKCHHIFLKYKLKGEIENSVSHLAYKREDGWYMTELYWFNSEQSIVDLEIWFDGYRSSDFIEVEGIEFRPLEKVVEHKEEKQPISDSDDNWEEKLPTDFEDIMKWSKERVPWKTKKEAYTIICKGLLINDGEEWFFLDKNGKKCHMLSARAASIKGRMHTHLVYFPDSRFGEVAVLRLWTFRLTIKIQSHLVSSQTTYASYLVYKLPKDQSGFEAPVKVTDKEYLDYNHMWYIYLVNPQIPFIELKADQNTHIPLNMTQIKGLPRHRNDGWMEVQIWEFHTTTSTEMIPLSLKFSHSANKPDGLIIQGVEFRPI